MRRPLRRRLFLIGLAGVALVAVGLGAATLAVAERDTVCALLRPLALDRLLASCGSPDARAALARGRQAMEAKDPRRALAHFREATAAAPEFVAALLAQGEAAETLGELDDAVAAYTRAAVLDPSPGTRARLGSAAEDAGRVELAVEAYQGAYGSEAIHLGRGVRDGLLAAIGCAASRWPSFWSATKECPRLAYATGRSRARESREGMPQRAFLVLIEAGHRDRALALARARGWVRADVDYCRVPRDVGISPRTAALLAMSVQPERADCLLAFGRHAIEVARPRLARIMLADRAAHSRQPAVRAQAARLLRYRLPAQDPAKIAETLNGAGRLLDRHYRRPAEALDVLHRAVAADPTFPAPYLNIGRLLIDQGKNAEAVRWLERALEVSPDYWLALVNLGIALGNVGRHEDALRLYRRVVEIAPDDASGHAHLGDTLVRLGREAEALRAYQAAVALDPRRRREREFVQARLGRDARLGPTAATVRAAGGPPVGVAQNALERAQAAFRAGRYREALEEARAAVEASPRSLPALLARAHLAELMGEFDEAATFYARASELAPADPAIVRGIASFAVRIGDYDRALALLDGLLGDQPWYVRWLFRPAPTMAARLALREQPWLIRAVQLKIDVLMEKGDLEGARAVARAFAVVEPNHDYCGEARQKLRGGTHEEIFQTFRLAALAQPDAADCIWWYGQWLTDEGHVRLGRLMVVEGIRVTNSEGNKAAGDRYLRIRLSGGRDVPKRAEALFVIARQRYLRDGDAEGAARLLDEVSRLAPDFIRPHHYRARIAADQGAPEGAIAWLERAVAVDPDSWRTHRNLGKALAALGRLDEAEAHLRRTVELFPDDVGGRLALARVLYARGQVEEYARETQAALALANAHGHPLPEVRAFLEASGRTPRPEAVPPAPDPAMFIGWNYD